METSIKSLKPNTKKFVEYKSELCDKALDLKKKISKLTDQLQTIVEELEQVFAIDDKDYFSEKGLVKKEVSNSYSIDESNVNKVMDLLKENNLTIDDYINQKTSWGVTAKMRSLLNSDKPYTNELQKLISIKTSERLTIKVS